MNRNKPVRIKGKLWSRKEQNFFLNYNGLKDRNHKLEKIKKSVCSNRISKKDNKTKQLYNKFIYKVDIEVFRHI